MSEDRLAVYPARYRDARGEESTTIRNDGRTLSMVVRGVEFSGSDFDALAAPTELDAVTRSSFGLALGYLTDFVLEWTMPLGVADGDRLMEACLDASLSLESGRELLRLALRWEGGVAESREWGWFEDALADLQAQLPEGVSMRCCFACAFSDYHPVGHGLFGDLACFRDNKDGYLAVRSKADLWPVWPTRTEWVQETFVCPEFQPRVPGTGYRG